MDKADTVQWMETADNVKLVDTADNVKWLDYSWYSTESVYIL